MCIRDSDNDVCVQLLMQISNHVAISLYSVTVVTAAVMSLLLPIETKGRRMMVSFHFFYLNIHYIPEVYSAIFVTAHRLTKPKKDLRNAVKIFE